MSRITRTLFVFLLCLLPLGLNAQSDFFWEAPELFSAQASGSFPVSAFSADISVLAWQATRPNRDSQVAADGFITISLAVKKSGGAWEHMGTIGGLYPYAGTQPSILSMVIDQKGRIIIAAAASTTQTEILISEDQGATFSRNSVSMGSETSVAPRIFVRADGGYLLFITRGRGQTLSIYYASSSNGVTWTPFDLFVPETNLQLNFLPAHGSIGNRDIVFFQSFVSTGNSSPTFQLFFKTSDNGGRSWSAAQRFTIFQDPVMNTSAASDRFDNQRPFVTKNGNELLIVWERRYGTQSPQIYSAGVGPNGTLSGAVRRVNSVEAYCQNPVAFTMESAHAVVWMDNRRGSNRIFLAQQSASGSWQDYELPNVQGDAAFARPTVDSDGLFIFWQVTNRGASRIYSLTPDRSANAPRITAQNFTPSGRGRSERVRLSWDVPYDTSRIQGFSWTWSQDPDEVPAQEVMIYNTDNARERSLDLTASSDGLWYFSIITHDFAGNWSPPARVSYFRDTTPPPAVEFNDPEKDDNDNLISNTFTMSWQPPPVDDVAGYSWNLQYLGEREPQRAPGIQPPPARIMGGGSSASFDNQDDGYWVFTVTAIDTVGNIGPPASVYFKTNKYVPHTYVSYADFSQDEQGILSVQITGRGFSVGGNVTRVIMDRDGTEPYDRVFELAQSDFKINSDREISGLRVEDLDEGVYRLLVVHPTRGTIMTEPMISVDRTGTVKFGDYDREWKPSWVSPPKRSFMFDSGALVVFAIMLLCGIGLAGAIRGIANVLAEGAAVKVEAAALITGDFMPSEKKKRIIRVRKRGMGLRFKLAAFTVALVLLVVVIISTPLYYVMTSTQRETLMQSLWDRSSVLLEGLASSTRSYLPMANPELELIGLPAQMEAIPEARYVTITGYGSGSTIHNDHVWATNDPNILHKIDTVELRPGISRIEDEISPQLEKIGAELNEQAKIEVEDYSRRITALTQEAIAISRQTDQDSMRRLEDIQFTTRSLQTRINQALSDIAKNIGSQPEFSTSRITTDGDSTYVLFKPVMFRQGADDNYYRGLIRLEISVESIEAQIVSGQLRLLGIILIVALIAIVIGTIGAFALSAVIVQPIKKLVDHVGRIRDTDDKSKLAGVDINITTKDEIATLGDTINEMTHGLVKAAAAASDLSIGKEIQKKFIPLEIDKDGNKLSSGFKDTKNATFFGYYEGAKGVSGDYFDYLDLDGRYYAIIKCDVAGKGIPAALIMIQVATMFLNYFKQWKPTEKGMHIEEVVYQINDFIETLAFKGRFAAFTLCLFDSETGIVRFCNAGDNIVRYFDASEGHIKTVTLPQTPATGVLPNFLVESKGGYTVQTITVDHGDVLMLYTDGIEEAKRKFRDLGFNAITCTEGPVDTVHENHTSGQEGEEMGPERVEAIIDAVMNKQVYPLHKWHNGEGDKDLQFDFSSCEGNVDEVIMAMVSVEKMFRCFKDPKAGDDSKVMVDRKVDGFLKKHFNQYRTYCQNTRDYPDNDAYMYYTHLKEDEQYDDLTILGIKRK